MNSVKTSKRIFGFFRRRIATPLKFFHYNTKHYGNRVYFDGDPPNGGVECRWEAKIAILDEYLAIWSMTAAVRDQQLTVVGAVGYSSYSARVFMAHTGPVLEPDLQRILRQSSRLS